MRIEELVLEGFKSYPVRTSITGWDVSFNAITGLNGSGKSNILDAICFVLGITNMSQMRAQNQQDLIYKRGQAGITKASVTIVFDNSDREKSPVGLENCKQITVTRQIALPNISKYLLNGHKSTQQNVQTLFQSVQLNINNPNFLIMQGRITKVLNMRPQEILGMVEEASGTRMFEERKDKAKKTMGKKEKRVEQITALLNEEITPKLDSLRAKKKSYLQYQKSCSELEKMVRVINAWDWVESTKLAERKAGEIAAKTNEKSKVEGVKERHTQERCAAEEEHEAVTAQREKELKKGGRAKKLEENVTKIDMELVKLKTQIELKESSVAGEAKRVAEHEREIKNLHRDIDKKREEVQRKEKKFNSVKSEHDELQQTLTKSEELLQTLLTGVTSSSSGNTGGGYLGQIADARARLTQATTEEEQSRMKLGMSQNELKTLEAKWRDVERDAQDGQKKLDIISAEVGKLKKQVMDSGWSVEAEQQCQQQMNDARRDYRNLTEERESKKQRIPSLSFDYESPHPGFDRSKVKGLVASLISLKASDYDKATALEITAGGRLYNVIVQDPRVGQDLIDKGRLRKRVTIIPLNGIRDRRLSPQQVDTASRIAPGKVDLALSLVGYPDEVEKAMGFVFGSTFICKDSETAKKVTFSKEIGGARSVTLEGDVYEPSGTLSGGAAPTSSGILVKVQDLLDAERRLGEAKGRLDALEKENERDRNKRGRWDTASRNLQIKEHEKKLFEEQLDGSNASRVGNDIEVAKKAIEDLKESVRIAKEKQVTAQAEIKRLEKDMNEFKNNKEGKIEELRANISKQKSAIQKHNVVMKTQQKEMQTVTLELEQLQTDLAAAERAVVDIKATAEAMRQELQDQHKQRDAITAELEKAKALHAEELAHLTRFDEQLKELDKAISKKKDAIADCDVQLARIDGELRGLEAQKQEALGHVKNLEKESWIKEQCHTFGKEGTEFEFTTDMLGMKERARELEQRVKSMSGKVDRNAISKLEKDEKQEASAKSMLAQVLKDKEKIEETIKELDRCKREALEKTWEKVNGDFGAIFAELLPGNFAKLQPPDGQDLTQGLEVKVRLGNVWKQSLTELSGGQRSLIALSLIMSLLQFKPAPMYILDEIDAALDLSHTQHIGHLFRTRFKGSQFIVVSLKEGLFTNANVLFRTRFRDGTSIVERTAQRSTSSLYSKG